MMAKAILVVLLVLIVIAYGALFISWNLETVTVTGFVDWQGTRWVENVPLGFLILGAVLLGAIIMAIWIAGSWGAQGAARKRAEAKVATARQKLEELVAKIKQQRRQIAELEAKLPLATPAEGEPAESSEDDELIEIEDEEEI